MVEETEYDALCLGTHDSDDRVTVSVRGRLETVNSVDFLRYVTEIISGAADGDILVMDLSRLDYISSTGIGALATILVNSRKKDLKLLLKNLQPKVREVMDLLGFTAFFTLVED